VTDKETFRRRVIRDGIMMPGFDPTPFPDRAARLDLTRAITTG
jgi:hypothetical protein